ncbi:MAG: LysE family transporter, partial [Desulfuromonadales bacterium]|nr:LysE family transporter [Desulfuromonadales bacterium]
VLSRSLAQGTPAGLVATAGLAAGSLVHVTAAALGLSAVFVYSPVAYGLLKLAGAGYLVYLGLITLFARGTAPGTVCAAAPRPPGRIFRQSIL